MQPREARQTVRITARMKTAAGWQDVAIRNVSPHGMRISVSVPVKRGAFIEVRRASQVIVARAVWVEGNECGLRTQDAVDIPALVDPKATKAERVIGEAAVERRRIRRPEESAAEARRAVRSVGFAATGVALLLVAGYAASTVGATLRQPFDRFGAALSGAPID